MKELYDAIVIGAGPGGTTVANLLASAGWSVAIVEKAAFPRGKVCGEFVSAAATPVLDRLGVASQFLAVAGPPVTRIGLFGRDTVVSSPAPVLDRNRACFGRALAREHLDALLLDAADSRGVSRWQPARVVAIERLAHGYLCTVMSRRGTHRLRAAIIIAAHGSWHSGRLPTQVRARARDSDFVAFKVRLIDFDLDDDLMVLLAFPGGYGGLVHTDGGRVALSCCLRRDFLTTRRRIQDGSAGNAVLLHIRDSCLGLRERIARASLTEPWRGAGPLAPGIRVRTDDILLRVGNAAGEAHPVIADGICMALQGGALLAETLLARENDLGRATLPEELAAVYATAWRACFAAKVHHAAVIAQLASRRRLSAALLPLFARLPHLLTLCARFGGRAHPASATPLQRTP